MITTPDRISGVIAAMEKGEQVDWRKLNDLLALDLAIAGQRFVDDAIAFNEAATEMVKQELGV